MVYFISSDLYHTLDTQKSMKPSFGHPVSKSWLRPTNKLQMVLNWVLKPPWNTQGNFKWVLFSKDKIFKFISIFTTKRPEISSYKIPMMMSNNLHILCRQNIFKTSSKKSSISPRKKWELIPLEWLPITISE